MTDPNIAPEGKIWVCMSCFAKERDRLDLPSDACLLSATLCDEVEPAPGFYALSREETQ